MIDSEIKKARITEIVTGWCDTVKATPLLRPYDIPGLVDHILSEFFHVTFCCSHKGNWEDGVAIAFKDLVDGQEGEIQGFFCKDCAQKYEEELDAWRI